VPDAIDRSLLARAWTHSHEEDAPGRMVFRPAAFSFPPSRGRRSLDLSGGGEASLGTPGPDDRPTTTAARWSLAERVLILRRPSGNPERFEIDEVTPERLVVRPTG
jgi:hypothetical protein